MNRLLLIFACGMFVTVSWLLAQTWPAMPRQVSVGDHQLRMLVNGQGKATVVFETFGPANLEMWNRLQTRVSRFAKVVSYDHAGYGGSEPGPKPRDAQRIATELRTALQEAGLRPPYLFVGYSFGGPYARVYADMFPAEVSGILFVDPTMEDFMDWLHQKYPELNSISAAELARQDEWGSQLISLEQARNARLPNVPIALITGAQAQGIWGRAIMPYWLEAHQTWLKQFPAARHLVTTNSGHGVILTEPDLVAEVIRDLLRQIDAE